MKTTQTPFFQKLKSKHRYSAGGELRKKRAGRKTRPLSKKFPHHIVFKINRSNLVNKSFRHPKNFTLVQNLMRKYAKKFFVKIEMISYQHDHIHIVARSSFRKNFHNFFRVFSGQIAQNLKAVTDTPRKLGVKDETRSSDRSGVLWRVRPFTVIVNTKRYFRTLRNYLRLNDLEVMNVIAYRKERLRGLSLLQQNELLWSS